MIITFIALDAILVRDFAMNMFLVTKDNLQVISSRRKLTDGTENV